MSRTRIFASSTCYDLAAVREDLREHIASLGHEPLLSEYPSFPVDPDENAIANCRKNIRAHTDILLLIIGGRRGFLDSNTGKSVTNLEYETARECRIPCFVFINRSVNTLFSVWKKNPTADFTPAVDYPEVFGFVERIHNENRWIFPFEKTADIKEVLTVQFSAMLRELLLRSREGKLDPLAAFASESSTAQQIARDRPQFWEFLLTGELLKNKIAEVRRRFDRVHNGLIHVPSRPVSARQFMELGASKSRDLIQLVNALGRQLDQIHAAWGPVGTPGDANEIKRSVDDFIELCSGLVRWEEDLLSLSPPEVMQNLKGTMKGWTSGILKEMERLPIELLKPFEGGAKPSGHLIVQLKLDSPPVEAFNAEIDRLLQDPLALLE